MVIVLSAGLIGVAGGGLKLGHFAAMRWAADLDQPASESGAGVSARLLEVFVGEEGLARGPC